MASTLVVTPQPNAYFDDNCHKYKCCCGCCHVKSGTLTIGILQAIGAVGVIIQNSAAISVTNTLADDTGVDIKPLAAIFYVALIVFIIEAITLICLFIGWCMENRFLLIPFMATQVLQMLFSLVMVIFFIVVISIGASFMDSFMDQISSQSDNQINTDGVSAAVNTSATILCIIFIVGYLISLLIEIWLFTVVLGCFRYFGDKQEFYKNGGGQVQYQAPAGGQVQYQLQQYPGGQVQYQPQQYSGGQVQYQPQQYPGGQVQHQPATVSGQVEYKPPTSWSIPPDQNQYQPETAKF